MPRITIFGPGGRDPQNKDASAGRLVNCFREPVNGGGRTQYVIRSVPGLAAITDFTYYNDSLSDNIRYLFQDLPEPVTFLATFYDPSPIVNDFGPQYLFYTHEHSAGYFPVEGQNALSTGLIMSGTPIGSTGNMVAGGEYIIRTDGVTVQHTGITAAGSTSTLGAITYAGSVSYLNGFAILTELEGRKIQWSQPLDLDNFPALNFATAEVDGDPIIRGITVRSMFIAFKQNSASFWQTTGGAGADAIAVIQGREMGLGLRAFRLLTAVPDGCAFCGSDGKVYIFRDGLSVISVPALESALQVYTPRDMFFYEWRGHGFVCLTFADAPAWCYDVATGEWHERSGPDGGAWDARCSAKFAGHWCFGMGNGEIYVASEWLRDIDQPLIRRMVSSTVDTGDRVRLAKVETRAKSGYGPIDITEPVQEVGENALELFSQPPPYSATGAEPTPGVMMRLSEDGGQTWGKIRTRSLGEIGEYETRMVYRSLGQFRRVTMELSVASPVDAPIYADAIVEVI